MPATPEQSEYLAGISTANTSVRLYLRRAGKLALFQALLRAARNKIAVEVIVPANRLASLQINSRYLSKLTAAGGSLHLLPPAMVTKSAGFLLVDNVRVYAASLTTEIPEDVAQRLLDFEQLVRESQVLRAAGADTFEETAMLAAPGKESRGIALRFSVEPTVFQPGQSVKLSWEAPLDAEVHILPDQGRVASVGELIISLDHDCILELVARRGAEEVSKTVAVRKSRQLVFNYALSLVDEHSGKEIPLAGGPELPHHYGIPEAHEVRIDWHALNCQEIKIDGRKVAETSNRISIRPVETSTIHFQLTDNSGEEVSKEIVIRPFSIPETEQLMPAANSGPANEHTYPTPDIDELNSDTNWQALPEWITLPLKEAGDFQDELRNFNLPERKDHLLLTERGWVQKFLDIFNKDKAE